MDEGVGVRGTSVTDRDGALGVGVGLGMSEYVPEGPAPNGSTVLITGDPRGLSIGGGPGVPGRETEMSGPSCLKGWIVRQKGVLRL